ncbi:MAG: bifunctional 5,10-methylenetetrahydrofolate dehydrogenase/5,10-methenyltetrahydrofolate cyclohydrolase [Candidatus Colwellbacteria bacterium]|nr:bifunctional 5,10-methylenetetrahydrofolate dehydrogenase/5,10-methenyltetrahydrofolate cyclohydrolase [Candidatus Colwellbacteria bacterium]
MRKIDGRKIADKIADELIIRGAPEKYFAAIIVGNDPASLKFVERKRMFAEKIGVDFNVFKMEDDSSTEDIALKIGVLSDDSACGGVMVQLPLPMKVEKNIVLAAIPKEKDADALIFNDDPNDLVIPPAAAVVSKILESEHADILNVKMAVIGMGSLVGRPVADFFSGKCAALWKIDKGDDVTPISEADVVVLGTGQPRLISSDILKDGAIVIDFGCAFDEEGKICGDFDQKETQKDIRYTPTPGGTGPILIAELFDNFYRINGR